jgi:hypothetical protein
MAKNIFNMLISFVFIPEIFFSSFGGNYSALSIAVFNWLS